MEKYIFPDDQIRNYCLHQLLNEALLYIRNNFENREKLDLDNYFKNTYGFDTPYEIADRLVENEKLDFDIRVEEKLKISYEEIKNIFRNTKNDIVNNFEPFVSVESLSYLLDDEKVYFKTKIADNQVIDLVKDLLKIDSIEKTNKKARIIFVCDHSGSIGTFERYIVNSMIFLLRIVLNEVYADIDFRFVLYSTEAKEVNKEGFYEKNKSGGSIFSSGLSKMLEIVNEPCNVDVDTHLLFFSDGDNLTSDNKKSVDIINDLIEKVGVFHYIEINEYKRSSTIMSGLRHLNNISLKIKIVENLSDLKNAMRFFFKNSIFKDNVVFKGDNFFKSKDIFDIKVKYVHPKLTSISHIKDLKVNLNNK